jgi:hypothetical protein
MLSKALERSFLIAVDQILLTGIGLKSAELPHECALEDSQQYQAQLDLAQDFLPIQMGG